MTRFREAFLYRKRENIAAALRRGIQRGDLPHDLDIDLVQDIWAGTILYRRLMTGSPRHRPRRTPRPTRHQHSPLLPHREAGAPEYERVTRAACRSLRCGWRMPSRSHVSSR